MPVSDPPRTPPTLASTKRMRFSATSVGVDHRPATPGSTGKPYESARETVKKLRSGERSRPCCGRVVRACDTGPHGEPQVGARVAPLIDKAAFRGRRCVRMRGLLWVLLGLASLGGSPLLAAVTPGDSTVHLTVDGRERQFLLHVPPGYTGAIPV